jgi:hypothetical protein
MRQPQHVDQASGQQKQLQPFHGLCFESCPEIFRDVFRAGPVGGDEFLPFHLIDAAQVDRAHVRHHG